MADSLFFVPGLRALHPLITHYVTHHGVGRDPKPEAEKTLPEVATGF